MHMAQKRQPELIWDVIISKYIIRTHIRIVYVLRPAYDLRDHSIHFSEVLFRIFYIIIGDMQSSVWGCE